MAIDYFLSDREKEVINARESDITYSEIASKYGFSLSRAEEIYKHAKKKIEQAENFDKELFKAIYSQGNQKQVTRIITCLERNDIKSFDRLIQLDDAEIRRIRNIGPKAAAFLISIRDERRACVADRI